MTLSEYLTAHGRAIQLAGAVGVTPATVSNWNTGKHPVPAELGAAIERATCGQVTRQELFPDTWARIWPELVPADLPGKFSGNSTIDHAAELRGAIAQTRLVFEGHRDAQDALEYLEQVLKACQLGVVNQPRTGMDTGAVPSICDLAVKIDTSDLDRALALAEKLSEMIASWAPAFAAANASIATTMSAAGEKAAAAMRAQSAQLVADAEHTTGQAGQRATELPVALSREALTVKDAARAEKIVDALCAMAAGGISSHQLSHACDALVAAVRSIPRDLASSSNG